MKMIGIRLRHLRLEAGERLLDALGEGVDPFRHEMPRAGDPDVDLRVFGAPRGDGPLVARQDDRRVLRRQRDHDDAARPSAASASRASVSDGSECSIPATTRVSCAAVLGVEQ